MYYISNVDSNKIRNLEMDNLIFVYGSLKSGHGNNVLLQDSNFVCKAITVDSDYEMISLGAFPALVDGDQYIHGEVYSVTDDILDRVDSLEGNGSFYQRKKAMVMSTSQPAGKSYYAWIYILVNQDRDSGYDNSNIEILDVLDIKASNWLR